MAHMHCRSRQERGKLQVIGVGVWGRANFQAFCLRELLIRPSKLDAQVTVFIGSYVVIRLYWLNLNFVPVSTFGWPLLSIRMCHLSCHQSLKNKSHFTTHTHTPSLVH